MTIDLLSRSYTLTFTLTVTGSTVHAASLPTYSPGLSRAGRLHRILSNEPALYQSTNGTTTATESNITLTDLKW